METNVVLNLPNETRCILLTHTHIHPPTLIPESLNPFIPLLSMYRPGCHCLEECGKKSQTDPRHANEEQDHQHR